MLRGRPHLSHTCIALVLAASHLQCCSAAENVFEKRSFATSLDRDDAVADEGGDIAVSLLQVSAVVRSKLQARRPPTTLSATATATLGGETDVDEAEKGGGSLVFGVFVGVLGGGAGGLIGGRSLLSGLLGALVGGGLGGVSGVGYDAFARSGSPVSKDFEVTEPVSEKLHRLTVAVMAADLHTSHGKSFSKAEQEKAEKGFQEAKEVLAALSHDEEASEANHNDPAMFEKNYHVLQDLLTKNGVMDLLSAEASAEDGILVTGNDIAGIENGSRGEDAGGSNDCKAYEGDMMPANDSQLLLFEGITAGRHSWVSAGMPWTGGLVNYCFASDTPTTVQHIFEAATHEYSKAVPCLHFSNVGHVGGASATPMRHQRCKKSPAIFVTSNSNEGCYAYVGMIPSFVSQRLQLKDKHCTSLGTAVHELGHALGMAHEQERPDRDQYVRINRQNIQPGTESNFEIKPGAYTGVPYDFKSIMHYDAFAFAVNRAYPTIEETRNPAHTASEMGQRVGLSTYDVHQVATSYVGENPTCTATTLLPQHGCIDSLNDKGEEICSKLTACSAATISRCCACGGGIKVQCYEGSDCPQVAALPPAPWPECIEDASYLFEGRCVYTNVCSFPVKWQCSLPCVHQANPGIYGMNTCQGFPQTEICKAKDRCIIWKE